MESTTWKEWRIFSFWLREEQPNERSPWYLVPWKNRFSRFLFMLASISTCTAVVYAWQPFSAMLFAENVYSWKCTPEEIAYHEELLQSSPSSAYEPICDNQDNAIQALYTINMATEFMLGTVAGVCLDYLGPLLTGIIGQLLLLCGVLFIAIASATRSSLYMVSMIFLGGGCNFLTFPAIAMADYFPGHQALIASLVIGCQNGSTIITSILDVIYRQYQTVTLQTLFLSYLLSVLLPLGVCFTLASPLIRPALNPRFTSRDVASQPIQNDKASNLEEHAEIAAQREPNGNSDVMKTETSSTLSKSDNVICTRSPKEDVFTIEMMLIGMFTLITVLQFNYYPTILRDVSGDAVARFSGWLLPTQGILGLFYGLIVDRVGTLPVCHALMFMIAVVYMFCLIPSRGLQYATTTIFVIAATQIYTVKFTFIQETFSPNNHGVLLGVLSLVGGLTLLINIPIHNLSDIHPVIYGMLASVGVCVVIVMILQIRKRRGVNHFGVNTMKSDSNSPQSTINSTKENAGNDIELV